MGKRRTSLLVISLCILMTACTMTGCRKSPALVDNIYTKDAEQTDPEQFMSSTDPSGEQDESYAEREKEQTQNRETAKAAALPEDETNQNTPTKNLEPAQGNAKPSSDSTKGPAGGISGGSQPGDDAGNDQGTGNGGGGEISADNDGGGGDDPTAPEDSAKSPDDEPGDSGPPDAPGPGAPGSPDDPPEDGPPSNPFPTKWDKPRKTVTDGTGVERNIPRDVYKVTAVGAAAPMVEMVGGEGRLLASSDSFTKQGSLANAICDDVIRGDVQTWWPEDGTEVISDENFKKLLEESPEVCFVVGGQQTFDTDQLNQLEEAGIGYVPLPELNSLESLKTAVNIVAAVLETNETSGEQAKTVAREYSDWIDDVISEADTEKLSGTMVISGWDDTVEISMHQDYYHPMVDLSSIVTEEYEDVFDNDYLREDGYWTLDRVSYGAAVGWSAEMQEDAPAFQCLENAGVLLKNYHDGTHSDESLIPYVPGSEKKYQYYIPTLIPFRPSYDLPHDSAVRLYAHGTEVVLWNLLGRGYGLDNFSTAIYIGQGREDPYIWLGDPEYKVLIAETEEAKEAVESSSLWRYHSSVVTDAITRIRGSYTIYINPSGFNSWLYGGVDAPLEMLWAACRISGTVSESRLEREVTDFYETFFGETPDYHSIVIE